MDLTRVMSAGLSVLSAATASDVTTLLITIKSLIEKCVFNFYDLI